MRNPAPVRNRKRDIELQAVEREIIESLGLVRSEYREIPGLHLTRSQVQRFWNLDSVTCDVVLELLTSTRFLRQTVAGGFVRSDCGAN